MNEKQKKIIENIEKILPYLTKIELEKLLSFGEGMAFIVERQARTENTG